MYEAKQCKDTRRFIVRKNAKQLKPFIDNRSKSQMHSFISTIIQRASLNDWITGARKDKNAPITLYTHILNDGFGDAGQLGYLVDKMNSLNLGRKIIPYATHEHIETDIPTLMKLSRIKYGTHLLKREAISGWIDECEDSWEIQYPVPTKDDCRSSRDEKKILRIHEMGNAVYYINNGLSGIQHTGLNGEGIGYGIPTLPEYKSNDKTLIDQNIKFKEKTWLVRLHHQADETIIKEAAEKDKCECLILLCNGKGDITHVKKGSIDIYYVYEIEQNKLSYLMTKIGENGRIYAGGEGMFVQALGASKAPVGIITRGKNYNYQLEQIYYDFKCVMPTKRKSAVKIDTTNPNTMLDLTNDNLKKISDKLRINNWFDKLNNLDDKILLEDNSDSSVYESTSSILVPTKK